MRSLCLAVLPLLASMSASALVACSSDSGGQDGSDASLPEAGLTRGGGEGADGASTPDAANASGGSDSSAGLVDGSAGLVDGSAGLVDSGSSDAQGAREADARASATDGGLPDPLGPVADGGLLVQFVANDESTAFDESQEVHATGTIAFGVSSAGASDGVVATLTRAGAQTALGVSGAEEIVSQRQFSFGTFRYRTQLATCAATEEAVNGMFTYFNDGSTASDGLVINREVDIEILCGEPWLINLTIWTEYTDDTHLENQSRVVDTRTGTVYVYADDTSGNQTGTESHPELAIAGFPSSGAYYEMGFTWAPDHLRYFISNGGAYVTLWDATDAARIPQAPMEQHFNLWAPGEHWSTGDSAAVPAHDATLSLDWFRYDPM